MPQVFRKSSNVIARVTVLLAGLLLLVVVLVASNMTPYTHRLHVAPDQPVPFSHKHHFDELGIDCRYCHASVEKSSVAGVPPTETCMTCHSQIWTNSPLLEPIRQSYKKNEAMRWNRVNKTPDFVYFDHSVHVAKGVSCFTCHGRIDQQNLTSKEHAFEMKWCLDCHRNPEKNIRPLDEIYNPNYVYASDHAKMGAELVKRYGIVKEQLSNCWVCHR